MADSFQAADPLEGLFGNLHNLVPLVIGGGIWLVATLRKLRQRKPDAAPASAEEAERTRRVQEELQRKIAARRGRVPTLDPFGGPARGFGRLEKMFQAPVRPAPPADDEEAVLARQERLAAQARALELAAMAPRAARVPAPEAPPPAVSPWLAELRDPASFRRAILLREMLGPPVALR